MGGCRRSRAGPGITFKIIGPAAKHAGIILEWHPRHRPPAERVAWILPPSAGKYKGTAVP